MNIRRRKLIEELNGYHFTIIGMRCGKKVAAEIIQEYHDHVIEVIESQPPADQWIPCSERLPKESGTYIVTGAWKGEPRKIWLCELLVLGSLGGGWCNDARNPIVEAWMPLPEPYKGVE